MVMRAEGITRVFLSGPERIEVLRGVDLEVRHGEIVAILGPSGSGKSTLLHILGGLDRPTGGRVLLDNVDVSAYPESALPELRNRRLGFVFQFHYLLPEFTVLENVAMPLLIAGMPREHAWERAYAVLEEVGFLTRLRHRPSELSGGERAKVAVARALVNDPVLILADEPTGNLDAAATSAIVELMCRLSAERGRTILVVTHNPAVANRATRQLHLQDGIIVSRLNGALSAVSGQVVTRAG